jgi:carbamate kinase
LLTDVAAIYEDWPAPTERPIRRITPTLLRARTLPAGSMGPKAEAACRFVEQTGRSAAIGALADAARVLVGSAGTIVSPD